jgi:hypothetical protein
MRPIFPWKVWDCFIFMSPFVCGKLKGPNKLAMWLKIFWKTRYWGNICMFLKINISFAKQEALLAFWREYSCQWSYHKPYSAQGHQRSIYSLYIHFENKTQVFCSEHHHLHALRKSDIGLMVWNISQWFSKLPGQ